MTTFLSVNEAADELRVQPRTVRDYIRSGRLAATRIGKQYRIRVEDLRLLTGAPASAPTAAPGDGAPTTATVILDIDAHDVSIAERLTTLVTAQGFASGVDAHLSRAAGSRTLRIILSGSAGGVLEVASTIHRAVEAIHA